MKFSEQGKRKLMEGMLNMPDSPFFMAADEMRAHYDDLRISRTDGGQLAVELAYHGKSVLTMHFPMPAAGQKLSILGNGNMAVEVQV
jgi:hypothetical protein